MMIELTKADVDLIREALDSHIYWQLSEEGYRNDGAVREPGSDEPEAAAEIQACYALTARLEKEEAHG